MHLHVYNMYVWITCIHSVHLFVYAYRVGTYTYVENEERGSFNITKLLCSDDGVTMWPELRYSFLRSLS